VSPDPGAGRFDVGVSAWQDSVGLARYHVRQELVARQLHAHLADRGPLAVLDAGCGQGTQAIRLARSGHEVTGLDVSHDLLADARAAAEREPSGVTARLRFAPGDVMSLDPARHGEFDLVCCHGVVMYLDSVGPAIGALASVVRPGGLLSVLTRNRAGIAMRAGMTGDWAGALAGFDARHYDNRIGVADVRADEPDEVAAAFAAVGVDRTAWYGVRLFSDHWGDVAVPEGSDDLVAAEEEAGRRDPYRRLAALTHTIGIRC